MNMKVANDNCCARKEGIYYMTASATNDIIAYRIHPYKGRNRKLKW
jgi:hypothetical protein